MGKQIELDAYGNLVRDANEARFNNTSPERVEAARLMLTGRLPPLPPCVDAMFQTEFSQVAMCAISQGGKIAYIGITRDGRREIREWDVMGQSGRCLLNVGNRHYVGHLHYPQGSEEVAFSVIAPDGMAIVCWGDWKFDATDTDIRLDSVHFFRCSDSDLRHCVVVFTRGDFQFAHLIEGDFLLGTEELNSREIACGECLKVLGRFNDRIVVCAEGAKGARVLLVGKPGEETWRSDWYEEILHDSVMLRDGNVSFVGLLKIGERKYCGSIENAYLVSQSGEKLIGEDVSSECIHSLKDGQIFISGYVAEDRVFLRDVRTNNRIELGGRFLCDVFEIPSGLIVRTKASENRNFLYFVHENCKVVPDLLIQTKVWGNIQRWGDHLVFATGIRDTEHLNSVNIHEEELRIAHTNDSGMVEVEKHPLYTDFNDLVHTDVGILSWHFVNGTFYVIRYQQ